jgi:predicted ATPase/DNA-binding SARP family transcriptional activator
MPSALRVELLGPLQVRDAAGRLVHLGGRRPRVLLILLALQAGRVVSVGWLAEQIWPDEPPGHPGNALQTLVSRLRADLRRAGFDELIESHPAGYSLAVPSDAVDVSAFEALAAEGRHALADGDPHAATRLLRTALASWRGQPLADAAGCDAADVAAARLSELRSAVLADRIEADLALGEGASLVGELRALTSADPLAERPRALLMRALYAAGRQAEALSVYTEARELLAGQLGVDPSAQLEQVYLRILRGEEGATAQARATSPSLESERPMVPGHGERQAPLAPNPVTSFVGRDTEVAQVLKTLRAARLVTLTGPGGVGKTRLAAEVSGRLARPAWFVELAPVSVAEDVAYAVLDAFGIREPVIARRAAGRGTDPLDRLAAALAGQDDVLVLDNCEHVIEAAAELSGRILAACPRMRIVATSRQPLRIDGEVLYPVTPLPVPPHHPPPAVYESYASVRLLCDRAVAVRPDFELNAGNAAAVARICRALDGMPLAIELAAVWLRTLTPAQLAERLDDRFALLVGGSRTALPRHKTLRAVVDWSWDLLSDAERVLARRLAIFPGGATLAAAEHVCADRLLPRAEVLPATSGLVDKSIVAAAAGQDDTRYRMLETVRAYGLERLDEAGEQARVRDAFAAYYLELAETSDPLLRTSQQRHWVLELGAEQDNVHAALRWAIARRDGDTALRFVLALSWYWMLRGQPGEPEALARQVLTLQPRERSQRMAEARMACALMAAGPLFDMDAVRPALTAALADLAEWSPDGLAAHPLAAMAEPMLAMYDRDPGRAVALLDRHTSAPDPWTRAAVPLQRGAFGSMLGHLEEAESEIRAALAAFRELGDTWATAASLVQLAEFARLRADYATAIECLTEAESLGEQLGAWGDLGHISGYLATVRMRAGDLAGARADLERAERDEARRGIVHSDAAMWLGMVRAELHAREGDTAAAARQCEKVLSWLERKQSVWWQGFRALIKARLALALLADGDAARSRGLLSAALRDASDWVELPPLAAVIDVIALAVLGGAARPPVPRSPSRAALAATLLGAAHSMRSCFDESCPDARAARDAASDILGPAGFQAAYERGRALSRDETLALSAGAVADPVTAVLSRGDCPPGPPR